MNVSECLLSYRTTQKGSYLSTSSLKVPSVPLKPFAGGSSRNKTDGESVAFKHVWLKIDLSEVVYPIKEECY